MEKVKNILRLVLESTNTRFVLGEDYRKILLSQLNSVPAPCVEPFPMFAIVANEMFFLPAWLAHYRRIGVGIFYILVDRSDDGTMEFLEAQADVVVLTSSVKYGDLINVSPFSRLGHKYFARAGILYPRVLTEYLFKGQWGLYVDADEFLLLPPAAPSLRQYVELVGRRTKSIPACNLVFFPERLPTDQRSARPQHFEDLVRQAPFFDCEPSLQVSPRRQPRLVGPTKTGKLRSEILGLEAGDTLKTPLIFHSKKNFRRGSHYSSQNPASHDTLALAHFVFTNNTHSKIMRAKRWGSYALNSSNYEVLEALMKKLEESHQSLLDEGSRRFQSVGQLVECGIIVVESFE